MALIVIEGMDGAGKTTQAKMLCSGLSLLGYDVVYEAEPTNGIIGRFVREILKGEKKIDITTLQLLFIADRNEHIGSLRKKIATSVVVMDRYYYSTISYGEASGISRKYLEAANSIFPIPDKTFILELPPEQAFERLNVGRKKKEIFENLDMLKRLEASYDKFNGPEVEHISAFGSKDDIAKILISKTLAFLKKNGAVPKRSKIV